MFLILDFGGSEEVQSPPFAAFFNGIQDVCITGFGLRMVFPQP
jgi:hypothetical protein